MSSKSDMVQNMSRSVRLDRPVLHEHTAEAQVYKEKMIRFFLYKRKCRLQGKYDNMKETGQNMLNDMTEENNTTNICDKNRKRHLYARKQDGNKFAAAFKKAEGSSRSHNRRQ